MGIEALGWLMLGLAAGALGLGASGLAADVGVEPGAGAPGWFNRPKAPVSCLPVSRQMVTIASTPPSSSRRRAALPGRLPRSTGGTPGMAVC